MKGKWLVLQSDFGLVDGAVSAMQGVAYQVGPDLVINDLTHDIPPFDIFQGSYRLYQAIAYWPAGTVFVSVVDPGVGSDRRSVAVKLVSGQYVVTPDNGTLTHVAKYIGIEEVRVIDETTDRLPNSQESHTFHGRDVYAYNGARIANNPTQFYELEAVLAPDELVLFDLNDPVLDENQVISGRIEVLDVRFGSLWTNISPDLLEQAAIKYGDMLNVQIWSDDELQYESAVTFGKTFTQVVQGEPIVYINSMMQVAVGINKGDFSATHNVGSGLGWTIQLKKET